MSPLEGTRPAWSRRFPRVSLDTRNAAAGPLRGTGRSASLGSASCCEAVVPRLLLCRGSSLRPDVSEPACLPGDSSALEEVPANVINPHRTRNDTTLRPFGAAERALTLVPSRVWTRADPTPVGRPRSALERAEQRVGDRAAEPSIVALITRHRVGLQAPVRVMRVALEIPAREPQRHVTGRANQVHFELSG